MLILVFVYICVTCVRQGMKAVSFLPGMSSSILICNQLAWHIEVLVKTRKYFLSGGRCVYGYAIGVKLKIILKLNSYIVGNLVKQNKHGCGFN